MNLAPRTKIALALVTALAVLAAAGLIAVLTVAIRNAEPRLPWFHAYSNGKTVKVEPLHYCVVDDPTDCEEGSQATLPVPVGGVVQMSLPDSIADGPFFLTTQFRTPDGEYVTPEPKFYRPGTGKSITIESVPPLQLAVIEIKVLSAVETPEGQQLFFDRAVWSIDTE